MKREVGYLIFPDADGNFTSASNQIRKRKQMTRDNVSIGRSAKAAGDAWERYIEAEHQKAEMLGILAFVEHSEPHAKMIGGRFQFTSPGTADYVGTLDRSGLSFCAELKSTYKDHLLKSAVEPKQQRHLEAVARAGGLALLLIEFRRQPLPGVPIALHDRFAVPWLKVPWKVKRTAESVSVEDLGEWVIKHEPGYCYLSKFHAHGPRTSAGSLRVRHFPRE